MPVALHAAAEHRAVEDIEGGEQGGDAVAHVVVGHGAGLARLERQAGLGAVERLDLDFLVDREHQLCAGGSTYRPTMSSSLAAKSGSFERLKVRMRWGCSWWAPQMRCTERREIPARLGHRPAGPVGGFAGRLGAGQRHHPLRPSRRPGALPGLRVASRSRPSTPASANRRCQRQTAGRPIPARLAISATFSRSAEPRMIRARATCFWARLRSATIASKRARSSAETQGQTI